VFERKEIKSGKGISVTANQEIKRMMGSKSEFLERRAFSGAERESKYGYFFCGEKSNRVVLGIRLT
jgi:hypothetical protein